MIGAERSGWRPADAFLAVFAGLLAAVLAEMLLGGQEELTVRHVFGVLVPAQAAGTFAAVLLIARRRAGDPLGSLGFAFRPDDLWGFAIGAGLQIALSLLITLVISVLFGVEEIPEQEVAEVAGEALAAVDRFLVVLGAVILAPLVEETVFRGILLRSLARRLTRRAAIGWSAAAFAALHLLDPNAVIAAPALFVVGLVLGKQALDTGRIAKPILTHMGFNAVSIAALFLVDQAAVP